MFAPFRVLLPTWRFFDDVGFGLTLAARAGTHADALGVWLPLFPCARTRRRPWHLLLDGHGNLLLAQRGLLERLVHDLAALADGDDPRMLPSYAQVLTLTREGLAAREALGEAGLLQFRLTQPTDDGAHEELVRSAVHPLRDA